MMWASDRDRGSADQYLGHKNCQMEYPPDNSRIRAAMLRYVRNPTAEEREILAYAFADETMQVLVPMGEEPDGSMCYTTVRDGDPHPVLYAYTAPEELPPLAENERVHLYSFIDLVLDMMKGDVKWNGIILDEDAEHSITHYFLPTGGYAMYGTRELIAASAEDPEAS